jgi:hypothetical protein
MTKNTQNDIPPPRVFFAGKRLGYPELGPSKRCQTCKAPWFGLINELRASGRGPKAARKVLLLEHSEDIVPSVGSIRNHYKHTPPPSATRETLAEVAEILEENNVEDEFRAMDELLSVLEETNRTLDMLNRIEAETGMVPNSKRYYLKQKADLTLQIEDLRKSQGTGEPGRLARAYQDVCKVINIAMERTKDPSVLNRFRS